MKAGRTNFLPVPFVEIIGVLLQPTWTISTWKTTKLQFQRRQYCVHVHWRAGPKHVLRIDMHWYYLDNCPPVRSHGKSCCAQQAVFGQKYQRPTQRLGRQLYSSLSRQPENKSELCWVHNVLPARGITACWPVTRRFHTSEQRRYMQLYLLSLQ